MLNEAFSVEYVEEVSNPIDALEEIMAQNDWIYERRREDELSVHVTGKMGEYKMMFVWEEEFSALQYCCAPELSVHADNYDEARRVLNDINSNLWLGHFDMRTPEGQMANSYAAVPCFRHTLLMRGMTEGSGAAPMEDLIDIALSECERYYMTFSLLTESREKDDRQMSFAMMDVAGSS
jgi:hypothetical protein